MKRLPLLLLLPTLLALALVVRPDPRGPEAAGVPAPDTPTLRAAAHEAPVTAGTTEKRRTRSSSDDLLAARVALGCGACLLNKARESEPPVAVALLELAVQQLRACLSYEADAPPATELFGDARGRLEQAQSLLARAGHPAPIIPPQPAAKESIPGDGEALRGPEVLPAPQASPPSAVRAPAGTKAADPVMVGPDGVIYRRSSR